MGGGLCLQKLSKYFKTEKGNDVLTNVWARMSVRWREHGHVMEVVSSMEEEWSYRGGQFKGERIGHVTEVDSLIEGA